MQNVGKYAFDLTLLSQQIMSDFSSSNNLNGGLYELGYTLEGIESSYDLSKVEEHNEDDLVEHMRIVNEDGIHISFTFVTNGEVLNADIVFPGEQRSKLSQYFREVSDMLK